MRKVRSTTPPELDRLELTIRRLLDAHDALRRRAEAAETRIAELERALREVSAGSLDPVALADEVQRLEHSNQDMRARLERAHESVTRIMARLQFAEEEQ